MNEQIVRIVTSNMTTTFVQVQDAVTDPNGHVLVPPRLAAVPQAVFYQVGEAMPSTDGAPAEPLSVLCIIESFDEETGEALEFEIYAAGNKGSFYEQHNLGIVTRIPISEVTRKDCRASATDMIEQLRVYQEADREEAAQAAAASQQPPVQQPPTPEPPTVAAPETVAAQQNEPSVGGMATAGHPLLQVAPEQKEQSGAPSGE